MSDDGLFREGLVRLLTSEGAFVSAEAGAADVLLLDSRLDGALGRCAAIRRGDGPRVILVAVPADEEWTLEALGSGARGILPIQARIEDLLKAVRVVHEGQIWAPRRTIETWADRLAQGGVAREAPRRALEEKLSERERDVFRHAAAGLANREMARRLAISEATVKVHLTRIFQKLGLRGRGELAAAYHGLLPPSVKTVRARAAFAAHRASSDAAPSPIVVRLKA